LKKAEDFVKDADWDFKGQRYGATINRSYYAIFACTQASLVEENVHTKTHQGAHVKFHELYIKTGRLPRSMAESLKFNSDLRQVGDYDFSAEISENDALESLQNAQMFFDTTCKFLQKK